MQPSRPYPSDLSDARWELIRPTLQAWRQARNGIRKPTHDLRALMNAILYVDRTGIPWRYLPHDFPPHQTVYGYFARWEADGIPEYREALTALEEAQALCARGRGENDPHWLYWINPGEIMGQTGSCLLDLGRPGQAAEAFADAPGLFQSPSQSGKLQVTVV